MSEAISLAAGIIAGGIISWLISWFYYKKQREELKAEKEYKKRDILRVITWDGIGDPDITSRFEANYPLRLDCVEYVRGVEKITHLRKEEGPFDVAIVDREFLKHFDTKRIIPLIRENLEEKQYKKIEELMDMIVESLRPTPNRLGLPVRCGLNAILINDRKAREILGNHLETSYSFLSMDNLDKYPDRPKIGIWNWYLPTLSILLLAEGVHIEKVFEEVYDEKKEDNKIDKIIEGLIRNKRKLKFFNLQHEIEDALKDNEIWVLPGGGGWNLPLGAKDTDDWRVVVPGEGAILWIECACILGYGNKNAAIQYIEYLLKAETQKAISSRPKSYKACPVLAANLISIPNEMIETSDKKRIFTDDFRLRSSVRFRKHPEDWRGWEKAWEKLLKEIPYGY